MKDGVFFSFEHCVYVFLQQYSIGLACLLAYTAAVDVLLLPAELNLCTVFLPERKFAVSQWS